MSSWRAQSLGLGSLARGSLGLGTILLTVAFTLAPLAHAQYGTQYRDPRSPSQYPGDRDNDYDNEDIRQVVARISYISGDASFSRGDDPDEWQSADRNVPMTLGDRVYTDEQSRLELQIPGGIIARLDEMTDLTALNLTEDTKQFSLAEGSVAFQIRRLGGDEIFEIDTPNAAVTLEARGEYRVDVDRDGNTRVVVHRGTATVAAGGGELPLETGDEMYIDGIDSPEYDITSLSESDGFDDWVQQREHRFPRTRSYDYVSADIAGLEDLDEYGHWVQVAGYGTVWTPTVGPGWRPYYEGHWIWQDPWGWTWVAAEPWGWAPYHYGRWIFYGSRWCWVPVARTIPRVSYAPALVAFVAGGPDWSLSVSTGQGGWVGWFPLAPADPLIPWWRTRSSVTVRNVTKVKYVNKTYITVVNQNTFVTGGLVRTNVVRDQTVIRQISAAPVARGALPLMPTPASLRGAVRASSATPMRPPREVVARPVVARMAPPPAPPSFQRKLAIIKQNRGAPVTSAVAERIAVEDRDAVQSRVPVRAAVEEPGQMKLRAKRKDAETRRPRPVEKPRGRPLATPDRPVQAPPSVPVAPAPQPPTPPRPREERQDAGRPDAGQPDTGRPDSGSDAARPRGRGRWNRTPGRPREESLPRGGSRSVEPSAAERRTEPSAVPPPIEPPPPAAPQAQPAPQPSAPAPAPFMRGRPAQPAPAPAPKVDESKQPARGEAAKKTDKDTGKGKSKKKPKKDAEEPEPNP